MLRTTTVTVHVFKTWEEHYQYEMAFADEEDEKDFEALHGEPVGPLSIFNDQAEDSACGPEAGPSHQPKPSKEVKKD
jgi:hypothetical protein